jgi:serine protease Do
MEADMSDDKDFPQEQSAYTAPAENGGYQFCSRLNDDDREPRPKREKKARSAVGPVIAALLIILAAGAAFCVLILQITLSVHYDETGFSVELVRKGKRNPIIRMEEPMQGGPDAHSPALSAGQDRYEWTGETLRMSADGQRDDLSFRQLYAGCAPFMGVLKAVDGLGRSRAGAAIVMSEDGAILASTHVITGASTIQVTVGGESYEAYIIGLDYATDLAVLKIDAQGLPTATFSGETVVTGDSVAVVGNPVGDVVNITGGMISAVNPSFDYRGFPLEVLQFGMILGDIASGSALVNSSGQIIGIVNCDMAAQLPESGGISFAISMRQAKSIIEELLMNGFVAGRPSSGLTVSELPAAYAAYYEYPTCLYISAVQENSTAAEAGLQRGDLILTANGVAVSGVSELYAVINGLKAGDYLTLGVCRDGETGEVSFRLMEAISPLK